MIRKGAEEISSTEKDLIFDQIASKVKRYEKFYPTQGKGRCIPWALAGYIELRKRKFEGVILQAGSLQWPYLDPKLDDGVRNTHFSYMFQADPLDVPMSLLSGRLPEMHVWLGHPESSTLIDFSTGELPFRTFKEACPNEEWTAPLPPKYLWCNVNYLPREVNYRPDIQAIKLAHTYLQQYINDAQSKGFRL